MSHGSGCATVVVGRFDALLARGLAEVLREDPGICVLATDLEHAALERTVVELTPDVAILDEDAQRLLSAAGSSTGLATGLLVLAHEPRHAYGMQLLAAGVACVARSVSVEDARAAIQLVAEGGRLFVSSDGSRIERRYPAGAPPLTPRELQVLEHMSAGHSYRKAASVLRISVETVRAHTTSVRSKLGVSSRRELVGMPVPSGARTPHGGQLARPPAICVTPRKSVASP
jgi:DNA-binding NarL/FixJ family response regulator